MGEVAKLHHTVPQFYLRGFANDAEPLAKAADVLEITGAIDAGVRDRAYELGGTLAATLRW